MAVDSLLGGAAGSLSSGSLNLLNQFLTDTVLGSMITGSIGSASVFIGSGGSGEKQGVVTPGTAAVTGSMSDGVLTLNLVLPANVGFAFEGRDNVTPTGLGTFLGSIVQTYLPDPPAGSLAAAQKSSLLRAIGDVVGSLTSSGATQIVVRLIDFVDGGVTTQRFPLRAGATEVSFDAGATGGTQVFAINLGSLGSANTLVLKNVESAVLAGNGTVRVDSTTGVRVNNDIATQSITGGAGNDTLIGGGGNDTLAGGAGSDIFGFSALGHFTVSDFNRAQDKLAFSVPGVANVADLLRLVTRVAETSQGVTYHFGPDASITLVGVSAADLTAQMIDFSF